MIHLKLSYWSLSSPLQPVSPPEIKTVRAKTLQRLSGNTQLASYCTDQPMTMAQFQGCLLLCSNGSSIKSGAGTRISSVVYQLIISDSLHQILINHKNDIRLMIMKLTNGLLLPRQRLWLLKSLCTGLRLVLGLWCIRLETNKKHDKKHGEYIQQWKRFFA